MTKTIQLQKTLQKCEERKYIRLPFAVPDGVEEIAISYRYSKAEETQKEGTTLQRENACIDLALAAPGGYFLGSSGSARSLVCISAVGSTPGYENFAPCAGEWEVILGAYHLPEQGLKVECEVAYTYKTRRLFKGDTHMHTTASDGAGSLEQVIELAKVAKLDYIFITDHNNFAQNKTLPLCDADITVMPGTEWTHYEGHAGMLGVEKAFTGSYCTENLSQTIQQMQEARDRGAFVVLNHPFCELVPWNWGFGVPFDGIEVWNGVALARNEKAVWFWNDLLCKGMRIPATGGSDFHKPELFGDIGRACLCLYALSRQPQDLMAALRKGTGYITYQPDGPGVDIDCGGLSFGDVAPQGDEVQFAFSGLQGADEIRIVTDLATRSITCEENTKSLEISECFAGAKFVRVEVFRAYAPGLPALRAMMSNPLYFS